jgi:hypothetical protein
MNQARLDTMEIFYRGRKIKFQYEILNLRDGWFDLTIWHDGKSIMERVPNYLADPKDDVKNSHGAMILKKLIKCIDTD